MMVSLLTNESGQHTFMVSFVVPFRCSWTVMSALVHLQTLPAASLSHHLSKMLACSIYSAFVVEEHGEFQNHIGPFWPRHPLLNRNCATSAKRATSSKLEISLVPFFSANVPTLPVVSRGFPIVTQHMNSQPNTTKTNTYSKLVDVWRPPQKRTIFSWSSSFATPNLRGSYIIQIPSLFNVRDANRSTKSHEHHRHYPSRWRI